MNEQDLAREDARTDGLKAMAERGRLSESDARLVRRVVARGVSSLSADELAVYRAIPIDSTPAEPRRAVV